jgi:hypothetical protein
MWHRKASELMQRDMLKAWKELEDWRMKQRSPQRWLTGWTPERVLRDLEEKEWWTLELWLYKNDRWATHRMVFEETVESKDMALKLVNYSYQIGAYGHPPQLHDGKWMAPTLRSLREYPCMMMIPRRKVTGISLCFGLGETAVRKEAPATWTRADHQSKTDSLFPELWENFAKARARDYKSDSSC